MSDRLEQGGTEVMRREELPEIVESHTRFDLAEVSDPTAGLETARKLVAYMAKKCTGPEYIAQIQGRKYPKVDWWTTVGGGLGLFPREESCRKLDREGEIAYEATVGVYNGDQLVTRASAICSSEENTWSGRDEYAIRSMAITRATGKAYRVGLSFLPVMAGLEPTPAEEMPAGNGSAPDTSTPVLERHPPRGKHSDSTWAEVATEHPGYVKWASENTDWLTDDDLAALRRHVAGDGAKSGDESGDDGPAFPPIEELRTRIMGRMSDFISAPDMMRRYLVAYAEAQPNLEDDPMEWDQLQAREALDDLEDRGMAALKDLEPGDDTLPESFGDEELV